MLYTHNIVINLPRARVVELFENPDNLKEWQTGLQAYEFLSGEPGMEGSTMKLDFMVGKRQIDLKETITKNTLPEEFHGKYEWKNGWNTLKNKFIIKGENQTLWETETEMHFSGFMKVIGFLMPSSFKKNSFKFMENFKEFAESRE
ncbi:MAG: SRPBCC family protein [Flavobacteriales bacterium]